MLPRILADEIKNDAPEVLVSLIYKHENPLKIVSIAISLIAWVAIAFASKGFLLAYILLFAIVYLFAQSGFIAYLRGTGVRVSATQYPDVYQQLTEAATKIDLDPVPECYILRTNTFNALATRFLARNFVVLFSDVVDALRDHPDALAFYIGHELGHLKRRHLQWQPVLLPASFIPLLGAGYHRAREYTCDRHGLACSPSLDSAQRGLLAIATGGARLSTTDVNSYVAQTEATRSFWMSFHELIGDYPWLTKRVAEVTAIGYEETPKHPPRNPFAWVLAALVPRLGAAGAGSSTIVTVVIIGVLAAIAIPAYQDYTIRVQVTEGLNLAATYKAAVEKSGPSTVAEIAAIDSKSVGLPTEVRAAFVDSISIQSGAVVIHYGKGALPALAGQQLVLVPAIGQTRDLVWICGRANAPANATPVVPDYARYTSVPDKYLPMSCRAK